MKPIAIAAVFAAIVAGFIMVGPPSEARARKLDERRVEDLRQLANTVDLYRARQGSLPAMLDQAVRQIDGEPRDPVTGRSYPYRVVDADKYELCADFQRPTDTVAQGGPQPGFWTHLAGHQCFNLVTTQEVRGAR